MNRWFKSRQYEQPPSSRVKSHSGGDVLRRLSHSLTWGHKLKGVSRMRGKSLLDTFAPDHSQHLKFLKLSHGRGHENKKLWEDEPVKWSLRNKSLFNPNAKIHPDKTLSVLRDHIWSVSDFKFLLSSLINNQRLRAAHAKWVWLSLLLSLVSWPTPL